MTTKELFYKWLDKNNYELLSEYTYSTHKHLVKTKYGIVKISPKKKFGGYSECISKLMLK